MKITFDKEEVETIVKGHVSKLLPDIVKGAELRITSYSGEWEVHIEDPEPEKEETA